MGRPWRCSRLARNSTPDASARRTTRRVAGLAGSPDDVELLQGRRPRRRGGGRGRRRGPPAQGHRARARLGRGLARPRRRPGRRGPDRRGQRRLPQGARDRARRRGGSHRARPHAPSREASATRASRSSSGWPARCPASRRRRSRWSTCTARSGSPSEALAAARKVAEAAPERALAQLDVAELALETGEPDEAAEAFGRLRELLEQPEGQVAAIQGAIKVELARGPGRAGARAGP